VVCEGEIGSEYAVIRDGTVVVSRRGSEVAVLGPGDGFGEIALVDAVPRTATVTARGTVDLVCVDADTFVGAVCGHLDAGGVARRHVDELRTRDQLRDADDGS
jgi:CRP-like cAMP-binding protein